MPTVKPGDSGFVDESILKTATWTTRLIMVDVGVNNNKFLEAYVLPDGRFVVINGRVGVTRNQQPSKNGGQSVADKWYNSKIKKGYQEERTVAGSNAASSSGSQKVASNKRSLLQIALDQIQGSQVVQDLVKYLVDANIHTITSATKITFDESAGSFRTPRGLVEASAIDEARDLLVPIGDYVAKGDINKKGCLDVVSEYCMLIPQNVGMTRGWHERLFSCVADVQKQNDVLDALSSSLQDALTANAKPTKGKKKKADAPKVFTVELEPVADKKIVAAVRKKYKADKGNHYDVATLDIKAVWAVHLPPVRSAFKTDGMIVGGVMQLWHGTKASNLLSILKGGLVIPSSSSGHVTGRMFGDGLYFSDQSTKSLRYATNAWAGGGRTDRRFMFLADVAMGKPHHPNNSNWSMRKAPAGYDSTYAKAGACVSNNEMIVYRTSQADLTYLIEFTPNGC